MAGERRKRGIEDFRKGAASAKGKRLGAMRAAGDITHEQYVRRTLRQGIKARAAARGHTLTKAELKRKTHRRAAPVLAKISRKSRV